ncbi:MAG: carbohydrate ABC transporter permease [Micrococcales bacterium]|nr:carbohydrate ABC transporter permease [Micrococcales bacterium]
MAAQPYRQPDAVDVISWRMTRRPGVRRVLTAVAEHAIGIVLCIAVLFPFVIVVVTAFMTQVQSGTGALVPSPWVWTNFRDSISAFPFMRNLLNTVIYSVVASLGVMISSTFTSYALARLRWRLREVTFIVVLAGMMIPPQVTTLPLYVLYARMHMVGTLWPLILPPLFADAYSVFLLRQFFMTIPVEMTEAARLDGAGELKILSRIVVPLAKPGIAAIGLFSFMWTWNDFYNPLVYGGSKAANQTLSVGLSMMAINSHQQSYQLQMAASLMFILPVLIIFFLAQRVFVEGISITGIKG